MKSLYHAKMKAFGKGHFIPSKKKEHAFEGFREEKPVPLSKRLAKPGVRFEP